MSTLTEGNGLYDLSYVELCTRVLKSMELKGVLTPISVALPTSPPDNGRSNAPSTPYPLNSSTINTLPFKPADLDNDLPGILTKRSDDIGFVDKDDIWNIIKECVTELRLNGVPKKLGANFPVSLIKRDVTNAMKGAVYLSGNPIYNGTPIMQSARALRNSIKHFRCHKVTQRFMNDHFTTLLLVGGPLTGTGWHLDPTEAFTIAYAVGKDGMVRVALNGLPGLFDP